LLKIGREFFKKRVAAIQIHTPDARTLGRGIVAAILDDALPDGAILFDLAVDPPALWEEQRRQGNFTEGQSTCACPNVTFPVATSDT
jgi:hypothetical protein